jgi:uncharacterized protein (TIGR02679 family)
MADLTRLQSLLGSPETAWLVARIRERLERGGAEERGTATLRAPTPAQREAVARLFGRPLGSGQVLAVQLTELDALLREAQICDGVGEAVVLLSGPITKRRDERAAEEERWRLVFTHADEAIRHRPELIPWLEELRALGLLRRLTKGDSAQAKRIVDQAIAVAQRLPGNGIPLAELSADVTGDSHSLDAGTPLGTLAVRMVALLGGGPGPTGRARDMWAAVGVLCDELSAPVLALNLMARGSTVTARALSCHAEGGEPYRLSIRQLLRDQPQIDLGTVGPTVFICENPTVLSAAANRLGPRCAPLVCVEGQPRTAAGLLLRQIGAAGVRLVYHGDFDWGGLRIGNVVIGSYGAAPWRFSAVDYRAAPQGRVLRGTPVEAGWDAALSEAMVDRGCAVHEEHVLSTLLSDLDVHSRRTQLATG